MTRCWILHQCPWTVLWSRSLFWLACFPSQPFVSSVGLLLSVSSFIPPAASITVVISGVAVVMIAQLSSLGPTGRSNLHFVAQHTKTYKFSLSWNSFMSDYLKFLSIVNSDLFHSFLFFLLLSPPFKKKKIAGVDRIHYIDFLSHMWLTTIAWKQTWA